jgi:peptide chain release factor subunit 3
MQGQQRNFQAPQQPQPQPQQQQQPQQVPQAPAASRPTPPPTKTEPEPSAATPQTSAKPVVAKEGGAKVLSIGGDAAAPKAKVLSIGVPAPPKEEPRKEESVKEETKPAAAGAGAKAAAAKAVEKEKPGADKSGSGKTSPSPSSGRSSPSRGGNKSATRDVDAVKKEQSADVDDATLKELYGKEHINIVSAYLRGQTSCFSSAMGLLTLSL